MDAFSIFKFGCIVILFSVVIVLVYQLKNIFEKGVQALSSFVRTSERVPPLKSSFTAICKEDECCCKCVHKTFIIKNETYIVGHVCEFLKERKDYKSILDAHGHCTSFVDRRGARKTNTPAVNTD